MILQSEQAARRLARSILDELERRAGAEPDEVQWTAARARYAARVAMAHATLFDEERAARGRRAANRGGPGGAEPRGPLEGYKDVSLGVALCIATLALVATLAGLLSTG